MNPAQTAGHELPPGGQWTNSAVDPELLALPAPPQARRLLSIALLLSAMLGAASLLLHLRGDLVYSVSPERALEIGNPSRGDLLEPALNRYVRVHGTPVLARAVRYERTFSGRVHAVFPLAGQRQLFVQVERAALQDPARVARGEFTGRLLHFSDLGARLRAVRAFIAKTGQVQIGPEAFVLLADEPPAAYRFTWLLSLGSALMIAACGAVLWRWFRPLR